jgi:hypothetical protein
LGKRKVLSESEIKPRLPEEFKVLGIAEKLLGYDRVWLDVWMDSQDCVE